MYVPLCHRFLVGRDRLCWFEDIGSGSTGGQSGPGLSLGQGLSGARDSDIVFGLGWVPEVSKALAIRCNMRKG